MFSLVLYSFNVMPKKLLPAPFTQVAPYLFLQYIFIYSCDMQQTG